MKKINLYRLDGNPNTVYEPLGYDACMDGFDQYVTTPPELRPLEDFPMYDDSPLDFELPLKMHSVLKWAGIGKKDILSSLPMKWRVISRPMLAMLESLGPFEHKALPVTIWDALVEQGDDPRKPSPRRNDDYVLLYLPKSLKVLDYRRSEYGFHTVGSDGSGTYKRRSGATEDEITHLEAQQKPVTPRKIVLTISENVLPPVFRLHFQPGITFMTEWAAQKLSKAGLNNLYLPATMFEVHAQDDVPTAANS